MYFKLTSPSACALKFSPYSDKTKKLVLLLFWRQTGELVMGLELVTSLVVKLLAHY